MVKSILSKKMKQKAPQYQTLNCNTEVLYHKHIGSGTNANKLVLKLHVYEEQWYIIEDVETHSQKYNYLILNRGTINTLKKI